MSLTKMNWETIAVHGTVPINETEKDVIQSIHLSTTFQRNSDGSQSDYSYSRAGNPNRFILENKLAALEGAATAITFSSGLAAINALFENILQPGSHVIMPDDCYHGTRNLMSVFFARWQVHFDETDMTDVANIERLIRPATKLIWIETPSNPQLKIADIKAIVLLAKKHNILSAADNTFATPILQKPLGMGVDYVMHSSTKFFGGHSDILGGVVCTDHNDDISKNIRNYQAAAGAVPSAFDCWLLNRSLATFPLRLAAQCKSAFKIAAFLEKHKSIEKVFYPGLSSHKNHTIALQQMKNGFGSIISVLISGGRAEAMQFANNLNIFKHATSLGGVESLVEHRRSAEGAHPVSPENLIRISVGIEHVDDLMEDLDQALR
jgi:cystathionine gamma-synthase